MNDIPINFVAIAALIGVFLPLVTSLIKHFRRTWPTQVVKVFAFVVAIGVAFIQTGVDQGWSSLDWRLIATSFTVIYTLAQTTYQNLWRDTALEAGLALTFNREGGYTTDDVVDKQAA